MKSYLKFLSRNKVYTFINIVGLSVSLAFVIIIGLYSQMEFGRDRWHKNADRIYVTCMHFEKENETEEVGHWALQPLLCPRFPDIETSCAIASERETLTLGNQEKKEVQAMFTDASFFQIFDFPLTMGDRQTVLTRPEDIVITDELAKTLFGDSNPMGKTVVLRDTVAFTVRGVMKPLNHTYLRPADILLPAQCFPSANGAYNDPTMNSFGNWCVYFLAREGVDLTRSQDAMQQVLAQNVWLFKPDNAFGPVHLQLKPLRELYFSSINSNPFTIRGDHKQSQMLFLGGLIILLFAVMNYVNLTIAQSRFRMREMAMRRLLGSQRWQVVVRLIAESMLLSLASLSLAVLLVLLAVPYANQMLRSVSTGMTWIDEDSSLQIDIIQSADLLSPVVICGLVAFALVLGVVAGIGPAWHISKARPIDIVKGTPQIASLRRWRTSGQALSIIFQHVITMVLLAVALTMMLQMRHLVNAPLGYNHERLMEVRAPQFGDPRMTVLLDEVRKLPCVEDAALGLGSPLHAGSNNTYEIDGRTIAWQQFRETESWMRMLDLKIITDYGTTGPNGVKTYVTPNALALHGLPAEARAFRFSKNSELTQIDGLIEPVHLHNILETTYEGRPQMVQLYKEPLIKYCLMMRYQGDKDEAKRQVGEVYRKVFERDMENNFNFYDDQLRSCYDKEHRILSLVEVFTVVAFLIAMLGLLAMSTFYLQQHRKEIAVRKAFGGTSSEVLFRLLSRFMAYVVVAFVIAIPIIYYIGNDWLSNFSYRIALSPWIFVAAGSACFIISLLTVIVQSWHAASENPINNIKTE